MPVVRMPDGTLVDMPDNPTPEQLAELERVNAEEPSTLGRGVRSLISGFGKAATQYPKALKYTPIGAATGFAFGPQIEKMTKTAEDFYTRMGKEGTQNPYGRAALESLGGALASPTTGAPVRAAIGGLAGGLGAEAGSQLSGGSPLAQILGGILGGSISGLGGRAVTNRAALAKEILEGVDPNDLSEARRVMQGAQAQGLPMSLAQAMGKPSNIDDAIADLAQSRFGNKTIAGYRAQPEIIARMAQEAKESLPGTITSKQEAANRAQRAATLALEAAQKKAGKAAEIPPGTRVPTKHIQAFEARLDDLARQNPNTAMEGLAARVKEKLTLGTVPGQPPIPVYLSDAQKLKNAIDDAIQDFGKNYQNTAAGMADMNRYAQLVRSARNDTVRAGTPAWAQASAASRRIFETEVEPMKQSVVGRIAGKGFDESVEAGQTKLFQVFKQGTPNPAHSEILTLEHKLRKVDPQAFPSAAKTYLAETVDNALKSKSNRTNDQIARDLYTSLYDSPAQKQGTRDILFGIARSTWPNDGKKEGELVKGFEGFLKTMGHLARRPGMITGLPRADAQTVGGKSVAASIFEIQYNTQVGRKIRMFFSGDAYRTMDSLLNTPEGIKTLQALSRTAAGSPQAINAVGAFFGGIGSFDEPQE